MARLLPLTTRLPRLATCALAVLVVTSVRTAPAAAQYEPAGCLQPGEVELAQLIDDYRQQNGLAAVPLSSTLTDVAQWHVQDVRYAIAVTGDYGSDPQCNLHTWYGIPQAPYGTCCYTPDHAQAQCMWDKPSEIQPSFVGFGFEIAAFGQASPAAALADWQQSPSHDEVILNRGIWAGSVWTGMGVGVDLETNAYFVWFSNGTDPAGAAVPCPATSTAPSSAGLLRAGSIAPNPFNPRVSISFALSSAATTRATVHDLQGRRIATLLDAERGAGRHELIWNGLDDGGRSMPSGVYVLQVRAGAESWTSKLALVR